MELNHNIDNMKCLVRLSHFTHKEEDKNTFHNAYAFAIQHLDHRELGVAGAGDAMDRRQAEQRVHAAYLHPALPDRDRKVLPDRPADPVLPEF